VRLKGSCGPRTLIFYCSSHNFTGDSILHLLLRGKCQEMILDTVFYLVSANETECYGSPLFLRLIQIDRFEASRFNR